MIVYRYVFILLVLAVSISAQTPQKIEQELIKLYAKVSDNSSYKSNSDIELLEKANNDFKAKMLKYTKIASTLKHSFKDLDKEISISTSKDGKFRIYSWDLENDGTAQSYDILYQFKDNKGKIHSESANLSEGDFGAFVSDIFQVKLEKATIYLARFTAILGTSLNYQQIQGFKIGVKSLNKKVKIFKTTSGLQNSIGFEYDFFSVVDRPERPIKLIVFDEKTNTVKIPVVIKKDENDYGTVTDKFISYKFNGTYFVKVN